VVIESVPAGAQVLFDGKVAGTTPFRGTISQRTDNVTFVLRLAGYDDKTVTVPGNAPISERVRLINPRDKSRNPFLTPGGQ
jgi:hypothetical protein